MILVRPTSPPSMSVIVDTLINGDILVNLLPSHPTMSRIDIIYITGKVIGYVIGTLSMSPRSPVLPVGARGLAKIYVHSQLSSINGYNIIEIYRKNDES